MHPARPGGSAEHWFAWLVVLAVVGLNAAGLAPELSIGRANLNDSVFHYAMIDRVVQAIQRGENPLDFWVSEWALGYPVPRTYQPLGHLSLALLYLALGKTVSLITLFCWASYLLVVLLPLTVYASGRLLALRPSSAAAAALLAPLVATNGLYGIEYGSYLWRGSGLYTQSLAVHLLLLALGVGFHAVRQGRHLTLGGVALALTFLAHFIYGYMAALSLCLLALVPDSQVSRRTRALRICFIGLLTMGLTAFELIPMLRDASIVNRSRWEAAWKWDSFGFREVARLALTGDLLDFRRAPVLSLLALAGTLVALRRVRRRREEAGRAVADRLLETPDPDNENTCGRAFTCGLVLSGAALWTFLFCGRPAWGEALYRLLGLGDLTQLHRLVGGVHVFLIFLAGVGLGAWWLWLQQRRWPLWVSVAAVTTIIFLSPALAERYRFLRENAEWGRQNLIGYRAEQEAVERVLAEAEKRPGRLYPGLAGDWGGRFRVASVPVHALASLRHIPAVAFLYHAMSLTSDIMVRFDERNQAHYRLFNIGSVLAEAGRALPSFLTPMEQVGRFRLLAAPASSYFDLVAVPYGVRYDKKRFYEVNDPWLYSDWVEKRQHLWLDFRGDAPPALARLPAGEILPQLGPAGELGAVESEQREGETYRAWLRVDRDCFVLFKMTYHPNWRILVDGKRQQTVMLSPGFLGAALAPGRHVIECQYRPEVWKMWLLWLVAVPLPVLALAAERRDLVASADKWLRALTHPAD
ncbi:MAG: hypothetical protein HYX74_04690 [Acidobacteria bacterium]|nr:hypothetical protein [Acidobacteriota bacterium]